jgi:DNA polymerase-3 subunit gamma/tau
VKFFFATTEPDAVLSTIISRCQRFDLRRIPVNMLIERLRLIAKEEKVRVDEDALLAVARGSAGGMRDAESALDQLISFKGDKITEEDVLSVFGLISRGQLDELAEKVLTGDIKNIVRLVGELDDGGKDLQRLLSELMEHFRSLLVFLNVDNVADALDLTDTQIQGLKRQAALTNTARLLRIMEILSEVADKMRFAMSRKTLIETGLIRCARAAVVVSLEEILVEINKLKNSMGAVSSDAVVAARDAGNSAGVVSTASSGRVAADEPARVAAVAVREEKKHGRDAAQAGDFDDELEFLKSKWAEIVDKAGKLALTIRGPLADAHPMKVSGDKVVVGFEEDFAAEIEKFRDRRNSNVVDITLSNLLKRKVVAEFIVARGLTAGQASGKKPAASKDAEAGQAESASGKGGRKSKHDLVNDKSVQKALEMFNGAIVEIRE